MKAKMTFLSVLVVSLFFGGVAQAKHPGGKNQHHNRHHNGHGHEALMVNLGASTTYGYTFDSSLLGLPFGYLLADNHHIPALAEYLKSYFGVHEVVDYNLSYPGKTSAEVLDEQLPEALGLVPHCPQRDIVFTVEGGGNDLRHFQVANWAACTSADPMDQYTCIVNLTLTLDAIEDNLVAIVTSLQEAAPEAIVILQTQYNSLYGTLPNGAACADAGMLMLADMAFEGNPAYGHPVKGLNVRIRELAADLGVNVGDIAGYLYTAPGDLYMNPAFFGGDCTHLSGTRDGIEAIGMPADTLGLGYQTLLATFIYALPL